MIYSFCRKLYNYVMKKSIRLLDLLKNTINIVVILYISMNRGIDKVSEMRYSEEKAETGGFM